MMSCSPGPQADSFLNTPARGEYAMQDFHIKGKRLFQSPGIKSGSAHFHKRHLEEIMEEEENNIFGDHHGGGLFTKFGLQHFENEPALAQMGFGVQREAEDEEMFYTPSTEQEVLSGNKRAKRVDVSSFPS